MKRPRVHSRRLFPRDAAHIFRYKSVNGITAAFLGWLLLRLLEGESTALGLVTVGGAFLFWTALFVWSVVRWLRPTSV